MDAQKECVADKVMTMKSSIKCIRCDILLKGREQFVGHLIHSHDEAIAHAEEAWESVCVG